MRRCGSANRWSGSRAAARSACFGTSVFGSRWTPCATRKRSSIFGLTARHGDAGEGLLALSACFLDGAHGLQGELAGAALDRPGRIGDWICVAAGDEAERVRTLGYREAGDVGDRRHSEWRTVARCFEGRAPR